METGERRNTSSGSCLEARVSRDRMRARQAQRLRHSVFVEELGKPPAPSAANFEEDRFDAHCEHLIVRDVQAGLVVGTCRILAPDAARRAGGYQAEHAFDLEMLEVLRERMVEVGRTCVHPDYRSGGVMLLLLSELARYLIENGHDYVMGSASVGLSDGGHEAASIFRAAAERSLSPEDYRVYPRHRLPLENLCDTRDFAPPPLVKAYLNVGAWVSGEPAWDRATGCALLPILMPLARMQDRYARHFLASAA